jgi:hypothetical protein
MNASDVLARSRHATRPASALQQRDHDRSCLLRSFPHEGNMDEHELTQELERFTTRFTDRVAQASEVLEHSPSQRVRDEALRNTLAYISSAIEIATGLYAEIDLLDMVVFIHLCRNVIEKHWIPTLYDDAGVELSDAFAKSEAEISDIADRAVGSTRRNQLEGLVDDWLADNPGQVRVEGIRLADFASGAARAAADRRLEARGILSSVKVATQAANEAMILVERARFLLHRMPTVWRFQARLSAREILSDSIAQVSEGPDAPLVKMRHRALRLARSGAIAAALVAIGGVFMLRRRRR